MRARARPLTFMCDSLLDRCYYWFYSRFYSISIKLIVHFIDNFISLIESPPPVVRNSFIYIHVNLNRINMMSTMCTYTCTDEKIYYAGPWQMVFSPWCSWILSSVNFIIVISTMVISLYVYHWNNLFTKEWRQERCALIHLLHLRPDIHRKTIFFVFSFIFTRTNNKELFPMNGCHSSWNKWCWPPIIVCLKLC